MFLRKRKKLPITIEDKAWIDENIEWLKDELSLKHFLEIKTVTPTPIFFTESSDNLEENANLLFIRIKQLMKIEAKIILKFYDEADVVYMEDGSILSTPQDDDGQWESSSGLYKQSDEGEIVVFIERKQLKDPYSMVATMAHELSHYILIGENRINGEQDDEEFLTDLLAIVYGFGIFLGNASFQYSITVSSFGSEWKMRSQGYLPEQMIAYAMAKLSLERQEDISYENFLNKSIRKYFKKSLDVLVEK